jgi:fibrillarin-like pre-rRNA processing protein
MDEQFPGVFTQNDALFTENAVPGVDVYGERLIEHDGVEYREWQPDRSKAAAAITKGVRDVPMARDDTVLYLGASTGTTVSHFADIVADGMVYAVEYAPKIIRDLLMVADQRDTIAPILGDARQPQEYAPLCSTVDILYQDVTQQDQIRILRENAELFLADDGYAMIAIKAQSISSSRPAATVFEECKEELREDFDIVDGRKLAPFHSDHLFLLLRPV